MKISNSQAHLHSVELSGVFGEAGALSQVREEFTTADEPHNEEDLGICLEHVFHSDEEGMVSHDQDVFLQFCRLYLVVLEDNVLA